MRSRCSRDRPFADVLIKCIRLLEHVFHVGGGRRIPTADILIEGQRDVECAIEIPHIAHSPPRNVSIEGARILEHAVERGCVAHIPLRNVTIKGGFVQKRIAEIGHIAHIPIGHNRVTGGGGIIDTKPRHWLLCQTIVNGGYDIVILEKINRQIQRIGPLGHPIGCRNNDWNGLNNTHGRGDRDSMRHITLRIRGQDSATINCHRRIGMTDIVKFRRAHLDIYTGAVWNCDIVIGICVVEIYDNRGLCREFHVLQIRRIIRIEKFPPWGVAIKRMGAIDSRHRRSV